LRNRTRKTGVRVIEKRSATTTHALNNRTSVAATDTTVRDPFHMVESPRHALVETISLDGDGEAGVFAGCVRSSDGTPLPGALPSS
jgi:hypothetical protein